MAATTRRRTERRDEPLSRENIVDAAIELLDAHGESGLTFRALSARLETGPGAIYWHVANKDELLTAATHAVVERSMSEIAAGVAPREAVRAVALGVFDALDAHPWIGSQLARTPWPPAMLRIFELVGQQVQALGVPDAAQFTVASTLINYIIGVGGQNAENAENARTHEPAVNRAEFLDAMATSWTELDPDEYPFTRKAAARLRVHDDRVEFVAGIDLILAGTIGPARPE